MNFPDRIFAIGGAGKEIGFTILETNWIVEGILEPKPNPQSLEVTIIDSAEGEENQDKQRIAEIRERIEEIEAELCDPSEGRTGSISVEYKLINENIQLSSSIDLIGEDAVPRITRGNGMDPDDWWLRSSDINENLDFAKGVVRKRGLGKAIYYKAYAEDDSLNSYIDLPQKGKVAVLAGLGGGTGSGILLDLVQHLKSRHRTAEISLFGMLPNHTEGIDENTNAFAALSELEYASLQKEDLFKDMVLVPIDPTGWGGKTGDRIQTDQFLEELDEAMAYLIASYYNTQNLEDPFANTPDYAPFTIGIPQVLRYRVEAINEARETIRGMLNTKEEALEREQEIYDAVDRFLAKHFPDDIEPGVTDLDEATLRNRLDEVEDLLDFELFTELNYESVDIFEEIIDEAKAESSDLVEQISLIDTSIRTVDTSGEGVGTFVDDIDEHLGSLLETELELLARRKSILERRKAIEDNRVRNAIEFLIASGSDSSGPGVKLNRLENKRDDLVSQQTRVETNLESTEAELEELREEMSDEVQRLLSDWRKAVKPDIESLQNADPDAINDKIRTLSAELERFCNRVINAESVEEVENVDSKSVSDSLETLTKLFDAANVNFDEKRRDIESSLTDLRRARTAFIKMNREESTLESLTPWESSTKEEQEQGHKDFRVQKQKIDEKGVFNVGPPTGSFSAEISFDGETLLQQVRNQQEHLQDNILAALEDRVDDLGREKRQQLRSMLDVSTTIDDIEPVVEEAFWDDVGETDDLEEQKSELEAELSDIEEMIALYEPAIDLFQDLSSRHDQWNNKLAEFAAQRNTYEEEADTPSHTNDDYVYIKQMKPDDVFRATGNDDLAESDLVTSQEEKQRIQAGLEELAKNALNQQYSGLQRRKLSKGRSRYDETKVRVAILSRAVEQIDNEVLDFRETIGNAYALGGGGKAIESPYTSWLRETGGPWDIGISVFISGVFLDNIRKVVQPDGYFSGYKEKRERGDGVMIHHSYGLEDSQYIRRKATLNMENSGDIDFYLREESEIVEDLLNEYIDVVEQGN